jgi:hypothetical protein
MSAGNELAQILQSAEATAGTSGSWWRSRAEATGLPTPEFKRQVLALPVVRDAIALSTGAVTIYEDADEFVEAMQRFAVVKSRDGSNDNLVIHLPTGDILASNSVRKSEEGRFLGRAWNCLQGTKLLARLTEEDRVPVVHGRVSDPRAPHASIVHYYASRPAGIPHLTPREDEPGDYRAANTWPLWALTTDTYRQRANIPASVRPKPDTTLIQPVIDCLVYVWGADQAKVILKYLSYCLVGDPARRLPLVLAMIDPYGRLGKNSLLKPLMDLTNSRGVRPTEFMGGFNEFLSYRMVVINELEGENLLGFYDTLKNYVSDEGFHTVNEKYGKKHDVYTSSQIIITTNHEGMLRFSRTDRRILPVKVVISPEQVSHATALAAALWQCLDITANREAFFRFLADSHNGAADTDYLMSAQDKILAIADAKRDILEASRPTEIMAAVQSLRNPRHEIAARSILLGHEAYMLLTLANAGKPPAKWVAQEIMHDLGFALLQRRVVMPHTGDTSTRHAVWYRKGSVMTAYEEGAANPDRALQFAHFIENGC